MATNVTGMSATPTIAAITTTTTSPRTKCAVRVNLQKANSQILNVNGAVLSVNITKITQVRFVVDMITKDSSRPMHAVSVNKISTASKYYPTGRSPEICSTTRVNGTGKTLTTSCVELTIPGTGRRKATYFRHMKCVPNAKFFKRIDVSIWTTQRK